MRHNWLAPNTIDDNSSHFIVAWLRPLLQDPVGDVFIAQTLAANQHACGGFARASKITIHRCSTFPSRPARQPAGKPPAHGPLASFDHQDSVVRHKVRSAPLAVHLGNLLRERVTRDGEKARLFGPDTEDADLKSLVSADVRALHLGEPLGGLFSQPSGATRRSYRSCARMGEQESGLRFFANGSLEGADISAATSARTRITTIFLVKDASENSLANGLTRAPSPDGERH
ncbi:hypothetical protein [Bradyrhizobium sp. CCBAU 45384]|uniref:hypothetical protein n=1 Tax=Bradyrhizobium sp. CCBAU 45384 TaxID=858428 RepID=UPI002306ACC2|nr:hypothetical protein [Bradyrhizobium sp. CCBAU 45384]MDA9408890.1 hypothetical protein [Bradyrhizobium sp. CCBAU 45384]